MKIKIIVPVLVFVVVLLCVMLIQISHGSKEADRAPRRSAGSDTKHHNQKTAHQMIKTRSDTQKKTISETVQHANVPIHFSGRVVDQNETPLEGVVIRYRIQQPKTIWDTNSTVNTVTSDARGQFLISNTQGSSLRLLSFKKQGYRKTTGQTVQFTFGNHKPQTQPESISIKVYTLIEENLIPTLVAHDQRLLLNWNGKPVYYDLRTGKLGQHGEIKITASRGPIEGEGRLARFDWSVKMETPGGGLLETTKARSYLAPEKGYHPSWEYGFLASDPNWSNTKNEDTFLFVQLEDGHFAKLQFHLNAEPGSRISGLINSYLNPSGGRILEHSNITPSETQQQP